MFEFFVLSFEFSVSVFLLPEKTEKLKLWPAGGFKTLLFSFFDFFC